MDFHYEYITTSDALREAVDHLRGASVIGVDTEGDSLYSYQEKVSLIQISGGERHFIIDPLLLETVQPLGLLLEERSILKIFHGADYDLVSLKRDFGFNIGPIFDTTLAARALGIREFSLQNLIVRYFQLTLSKTHQKSNWSIRPLPKDQLDYAAQDTAYLIPLYTLLKKEIEEKGRMDQIEEECRLLEAITWSGKSFEPDDYLRIKGARALPPSAQKVLRELAVVRDQLAKKRNRPPFKVISNDDLLKMAKESPRSEEDLKRLFPRETAPVFRNPPLWLNAVSKGLTTTDPLPKIERNGEAPLTPDQEKLLTRLKEWRNKQAEQEGIEPAMVITSGVLREIAKRTPKSAGALREVASLREWQIRRYGEPLLKEISTPPKPSRKD
ncbi:MAG: ribonuclease D [Candidatus Manganitrophaceae bacterium]|nr:MAG: ribonuclease D [Candidatus Manganitrophaceae bacterium]